MTLISRLSKLLVYVRDHAQNDFSGVGLVVYRDLLDIPAFPLRSTLQMPTRQPVEEAILELSSSRNPHHDGFHLLTGEMVLTHSCQYLAPPIDRTVRIIDSEYIGARYMTCAY